MEKREARFVLKVSSIENLPPGKNVFLHHKKPFWGLKKYTTFKESDPVTVGGDGIARWPKPVEIVIIKTLKLKAEQNEYKPCQFSLCLHSTQSKGRGRTAAIVKRDINLSQFVEEDKIHQLVMKTDTLESVPEEKDVIMEVRIQSKWMTTEEDTIPAEVEEE